MKLYESEFTPSCRRVTLFMHELNIDIEKVQLNVREGDNLSLTHKQKSINGKVPLLELADGTCISESVAICRYLDGVFENDKALFGQDALHQAQIEMWQRIVEQEGLYTGFQAFRNSSQVYSDRERCVSLWGDECKLRVNEFLPKIEHQLTHNAYMVGDKFTIVDITTFVFIGFVNNVLKIPTQDQFPHTTRWFQHVLQRPGFK